MPSIVVTGFPGFLGSALVPRLLSRAPEAEAICIVQPQWMETAQQRLTTIADEYDGIAARCRLVVGDITRSGLADGELPLNDIVEIHHLAAVYDLGVSRETGMRVNVDGTRNVLNVAASCPSLERLHYVSTCYVSGRYDGCFRGDDLECGQDFNNYYEETKFRAEVAVHEAMRDGLAVTIYRPAIVVGDSRTGATQKYDGPYGIARSLLRQPRALALMLKIGDPRAVRMTIVPRDFVIDAIAFLGALDHSKGRVYQLAGPHPPTIRELMDVFATVTGRHAIPVRMSLRVAKALARRARWLGVQPESLDYFVHPTTYDTSHADADLQDSGIAAPAFATYAARLVEFMQTHPEFSSVGMV
jgi:thioester reductase-like protein